MYKKSWVFLAASLAFYAITRAFEQYADRRLQAALDSAPAIDHRSSSDMMRDFATRLKDDRRTAHLVADSTDRRSSSDFHRPPAYDIYIGDHRLPSN